MIILFDLDGTLIDSTEAILESFHHALDTHDYPRQPDEDIKALIGYPLDIMFTEVGVNEKNVWDFVATYKNHYRDISTQKTILLDCAREAVLKAKDFATLGIVTTKTGLYSRILMEHFELMEHFDVLIGREDVKHPKPHAEPILKAIEALNLDSKDIWMIGDTKLDLISAKNAGINSVAVLSGYDSYDTLKEFSNIIFSDVLEAVGYIYERKISHNKLSNTIV
ncbi:HAD family hydrolase [bacterium]|nr:HAD family hydrolase [bacterium]MBU1993216.1 HAD family hydrolase [bacterium]